MDHILIHLLAEFSRDVYNDRPSEEITDRYKVIRHFWDGDGSAWVMRDHELKRVYLVIRGTATYKNVLTDLKYKKTDDPVVGKKLKTHFGFSESASSLFKMVNDTGLGTEADGYDLYITGHSLGGAIACLLGIYLYDRPCLKGVVTFGQPKVMNESSTLIANTRLGPRYLRVVNNTDPVACMPPKTLYTRLNHGFYHHFGKCLIIHEDGTFEFKYTINCPTSFWHNMYINPTSMTCGSHSVDDEHDGNSYVDNLSKIIDSGKLPKTIK